MVDYLEGVRPAEHAHGVTWAHGARISVDPRFVRLRRRFTAQMSILTGVVLGSYMAYVYLSVFERGLMSAQIVGPVNTALLVALGQFVSTVALSGIACAYIGRRLDPLAARLRVEAHRDGEGGDGASARSSSPGTGR